MCTILYVNSSPRGNESYSNRVAEGVIADLRKHNPQAEVIVHNLGQDPLAHIDDDFVTATRGGGGPRTASSAPFSRNPMS